MRSIQFVLTDAYDINSLSEEKDVLVTEGSIAYAGPPDGTLKTITNVTWVIDLGITNAIVADGTTDYDMVYYEWLNPGPDPDVVLMDHVEIAVSNSSVGPWDDVVFYWGDGTEDTNSSLSPMYYPDEVNNENIDQADLYGKPSTNVDSGILIDIDVLGVPAGTSYRYVRVSEPGTDKLEFDSIEARHVEAPWDGSWP